MWISKSKGLLFMIIGVLLLLAAVCLYSRHSDHSARKLGCKAVQLKQGYGYLISLKNDTLIYQPYIPAIGKHIPFSNRQDALKVGNMVCRKLQNNQLPSMSKAEIDALGISYSRF
ncbi:DUF4907 domain-containing protein [Bacteroidaceae bacterium HV4-6-C5C]|nr:DUF4907 domain-containing protein [Bacteroidaceae bacterium HV4-6-C5C]